MKRVGILIVMLMLYCGTCLAEPQWEQINDGEFVDVNSIKVIQVDYEEYVKATIKCDSSDGGYILMKIMINRDTKEYGFVLHEDYDKDGRLTHKVSYDPKDHRYWHDGTNDKGNNEILKRVP